VGNICYVVTVTAGQVDSSSGNLEQPINIYIICWSVFNKRIEVRAIIGCYTRCELVQIFKPRLPDGITIWPKSYFRFFR
jgi:hypothetical protein